MMRVKHRPRVNVIMVQRHELALACGAQANALLCQRAMADRMEHHLASEHQPHWPTDLSRSGCGKRTQRPRPQLASKTRAHELCDHTHLLDRQAEHLREHTPQVDHSLRRFVQRETLAFPY